MYIYHRQIDKQLKLNLKIERQKKRKGEKKERKGK